MQGDSNLKHKKKFSESGKSGEAGCLIFQSSENNWKTCMYQIPKCTKYRQRYWRNEQIKDTYM